MLIRPERKPILLRPLPDDAVIRLSQTDCIAEHDLRLHYTLSENDLAIIRSKRGLHNRLGFAIQLCYLRFPGQAMTLEAEQLAELLAHVARQIQASTAARRTKGQERARTSGSAASNPRGKSRR